MIPTDNAFLASNGWLGTIVVGIFQIMDFVGRTLPQFWVWNIPNMLWLPSLIRTAFLPLFVLLVTSADIFPYWLAFIYMVIFAGTNGYFGSK